MPVDYETAFEVSYLSNGVLPSVLGYIAFGLVVLAAGVVFRDWRRRHGAWRSGFWAVWCVFWLSLSCLMLALMTHEGWKYTSALRGGRAAVVEGVVEVAHRQPATGHDPGDEVLVGGERFRFSKFHITLAYRQTLAYGGVLDDGVRVRLHHLDGAILKVEVAR